MARHKMAVIGCGYWGPAIVRTLSEMPEVSLRAVADRDPTRLEHVRRRHPQVKTLTEDYRRVFDLGLDAVVVSTPPETHFSIVTECLEQGLDVFVEKPIATTSRHARQLVELADRLGRVLMVGHIGAYNPAVRALKGMIGEGELGELAYVDSVRGGLGLFHPSLNVIWDLAPHDIAILIYLLDETPVRVSTRGLACVEESIEDVAYISMTFPSGIQAHTRMSWLDPLKSRRFTVVGRQKMVLYDDLEIHEKLKVYDKRVAAIRRSESLGDYQFAYHYGSVVSPFIHQDEPLRVECLHFVECSKERKRPLTDGENGLRVVEVIEAAQESLRRGGTQVMVGDAHHDGDVLDIRELLVRHVVGDTIDEGGVPAREA